MKRKKDIFSSFRPDIQQLRGETYFRERESPTSLYISRRSDRRFSSEQEEKLVYAVRATRGHRFCGVLTTPGGRGSLQLVLFLG